MHTLIPEVNLAHLGTGATSVRSIQISSQCIVDFLETKTNKTTDVLSQDDDNNYQ